MAVNYQADIMNQGTHFLCLRAYLAVMPGGFDNLSCAHDTNPDSILLLECQTTLTWGKTTH